MRIWITGDLHGKMPKKPRGTFDAIICPGDVGSDEAGKHMFAAMYKRREPGFEHIEWYDLIGRREATRMIHASAKNGRNVLAYLNTFGVPVYVVPGNWDWTGYPNADLAVERKALWPSMLRGLRNVHDIDGKCMDAGAFCIIGYGKCYGPELPQYPDDRSRFTAAQLRKKQAAYNATLARFGKLFKANNGPFVLLCHNVPYNTPLDKIVNKASPRNGRHYGSLIARDLIRTHQPMLCIGGHMHEHHKTHKMGKTIALNTGFGPYAGAIVEIQNGKMKISLSAKP